MLRLVHSIPLLLSLLSFAGQAHACRCQPEALSVYYQNADAIFLATITSISDEDLLQRDVKMQLVEEPYKGKFSERFRYSTPKSTATCGVNVLAGKRYLFFMKASPQEKNSFSFNTCSGTRLFEPDEAPNEQTFIDTPKSKVLSHLSSLSITNQIEKDGIGGIPKEDSLIGLLELPKKEREHYQTKEISYEQDGVIVYEKDNSRYRVKKLAGDYHWIDLSSKDVHYHPIETLLLNRLSYPTHDWDRMLWPTPGAGIPFKINQVRGKKTTFRIEKTTKVAQSLWLYVQLYKKDPCEGGKEEFSFSGWIPAWNSEGDLTNWYYSRGC